MKLSYRGIVYEYNPPRINVDEKLIKGNYRGHACHFNQIQNPVYQTDLRLKYRGATVTRLTTDYFRKLFNKLLYMS